MFDLYDNIPPSFSHRLNWSRHQGIFLLEQNQSRIILVEMLPNAVWNQPISCYFFQVAVLQNILIDKNFIVVSDRKLWFVTLMIMKTWIARRKKIIIVNTCTWNFLLTLPDNLCSFLGRAQLAEFCLDWAFCLGILSTSRPGPCGKVVTKHLHPLSDASPPLPHIELYKFKTLADLLASNWLKKFKLFFWNC